MNTLLRSHFTAIGFLVPFVAMLTAHRMLGLSDAMMVAPAPGEPNSMLYNALMILAFYFGVTGYLFHVAVVAERSPVWISCKCVLLVVLWAGLLFAFA